MKRGAPLFVQVLGLVMVSLIAAQAISIAIILSLPPPSPEPYRLSDIARALQGTGVSPAGEARPLITRLRREPPPDQRGGRRRAGYREQLGQALAVHPDRIVISTGGARHFPMRVRREMRREMRGAFTTRNDPVIFAPFRIAVRQDDGRWLTTQPKATLRLGSWQGRVLLTLLISLLAVSPLAWWFARRLSAPISAFASAAERLGRDPRAPPLELKGSEEVNAAAAAFNGMQERLRRYVEDRTAMIGAIAHDLRTPLTRLRFRIEGAPEELRGKLAQDIDQMEAMISATLGFVRDATRAGPRTRLELASLVESVFDEAAETGADAAIESGGRLIVDGDPLALRRLVQNLLDNAVKYGRRARGRVFAQEGQAVIEIDDDGPGIRPEEMEKVFEPFYRAEPSRSRETGGAGLGLAVVRSIARAHGGDVALETREGGGLTARVSLPL